MPLIDGDIKYYFSDTNGNINLSNQYTSGLFEPALDIANDVEKKIWVKNTNSSSSMVSAKLYTVNGYTITNTNNSPVKSANTKLFVNIIPGTYSLNFPTVNSIVVTPPSGVSRAAQTIVVDGSTSNSIQLLDNLPIHLVFNTGLSTADTATIKISDGAIYLYSALDSSGVPGTYANRTSYSNGVSIGTLAAGQAKAVWIKQTVPDGISNLGNPRTFCVHTRGDST